ncbi:hypothetical protein Q5752_003563 [Cryptotrichosporon argae]
MFGRLTHYALDLVLVSAVLAGVRRSTGYTPRAALLSDAGLRSLLTSYLNLGEMLFGAVAGFAVNSPYFRRQVERGE